MELGQNFTSTMSEVQAISGATGDELETLEACAREFGATTTFSASEAAEALLAAFVALVCHTFQQRGDGFHVLPGCV